MNYQKIYDDIIERAKTEQENEIRTKKNGNYYERHHIIPKCMGGINDKFNLVLLTAREHFLCHWLLHRIYPNNNKISFAFWGMCIQLSPKQQRIIPSSHAYEESRFAVSIISKTPEMRKMRSEKMIELYASGKIIGMCGKHQSEETKLKIGLSNKKYKSKYKGIPRSEETKRKLSLINIGHIVSEETRQKISLGQIGKILSEKHKKNIGQSIIGRIWIYKDNISKRIQRYELNDWLINDWKIGRRKNENISINS
jgi:hypothetical protein